MNYGYTIFDEEITPEAIFDGIEELTKVGVPFQNIGYTYQQKEKVVEALERLMIQLNSGETLYLLYSYQMKDTFIKFCELFGTLRKKNVKCYLLVRDGVSIEL